MQLAALDSARVLEELDIPGYRFHALKERRKGIWSISVSGNWHVTFEFNDGNDFHRRL